MYAQKYIQRGLIDAIESRCLRIKYPRFPPEAKWRAQAVNRNVGRRMQWMSANHRDFAPQISSIDISWCFCRKLSESWLLNRQHSNQTVWIEHIGSRHFGCDAKLSLLHDQVTLSCNEKISGLGSDRQHLLERSGRRVPWTHWGTFAGAGLWRAIYLGSGGKTLGPSLAPMRRPGCDSEILSYVPFLS